MITINDVQTMKDYWRNKEGVCIKYKDMDTNYINACLNFLRVKIRDLKKVEQKELDHFPVYDILDGNAEVQLAISGDYKERYIELEAEIARLNAELDRRSGRK